MILSCMHEGFEAEVDWCLAGQMQHVKKIIWWTINKSNLRSLGMNSVFKQFNTHSQLNAHVHHTHIHCTTIHLSPSPPFHQENRLPLHVFTIIHLCSNTFMLKRLAATGSNMATCAFSLAFRVKAIAHWVRNYRMRFSVFFFRIPHQNACNGCENAENRTWSEFFLMDESFGGSVQTWLTQREVVFIFNWSYQNKITWLYLD